MKIWVHSQSPLLRAALSGLLAQAGIESVPDPSSVPGALAAIWDLHPHLPPYPPPPALPTLALLPSAGAALLCALDAGYQGCLDGSEDANALKQAVSTVVRGGIWMGCEAPQTASRGRARLPALTRREEQVLRLLLEGLSNRQIAEELAISRAAVKAYVSNLLGKLGVARRIDLIRRDCAITALHSA